MGHISDAASSTTSQRWELHRRVDPDSPEMWCGGIVPNREIPSYWRDLVDVGPPGDLPDWSYPRALHAFFLAFALAPRRARARSTRSGCVAVRPCHPRAALACRSRWATNHSRRQTSGRNPRDALLLRGTTSTGSVGARSWGQVRGTSGRFLEEGVPQAKKPAKLQGSVPRGAVPQHLEAERNLHGKEGVDGSSPSEGFAERPANRHDPLSV
jgi:hypothetical protein